VKIGGGEGAETSLLRRWPGAGDPVLYVRGATFPSALSVGYDFGGRSWADRLLRRLGFTLIAARTLIAGGLLLVIMRWRGVMLPRDAAIWRRFLFQAYLNSVIPWTLIAWGERSLDAGLATILNSTSPIFTFLLTLAIARHEALTARKLFGVLAGMTGICPIVGVQALGGLGGRLAAEIATVAATICYAGAAIFSRGFKGLDPMAPAAGSLLIRLKFKRLPISSHCS
jgi:drug/metabolite transporter (DMT)-like permease